MFFQSCMDKKAREATGIRTIAEILGETYGWPMITDVKNWNKRLNSWQKIDDSYVRLGVSYTFYTIDQSIEDWITKGSRVITVNAPKADDLPLTRIGYEDYRTLLKPILEVFISHNQANVSAEQLEKDIHDVYNFEKQLKL
ncbi:uncharacterized protein LOC107037546 [Diachasma alloeum]|uniref:uncharacterized protein LOC107037546 n=1 Tax=Diachasma alloeum TaxID=454923 RepID=UPI0007384997|nr:uncharacterized protein LOC107037546 [Diachasma alloeum]